MTTDKNNSQNDSIVLLSKQPNITSFASLNSVKKALNTSKVGHTGTLDSFAQGLLVVCTGRLTRLAGNITSFNKTYKAVIKFGEETDTLEYTGKVIKTAEKPSLYSLQNIISKFIGTIMQVPPSFSAIHVDGKRASSLARNGENLTLPPREVTIFLSNILETKLNSEGKVEYALIEFTVSKGTYIRSLARDIGNALNSAAHLVGLYRTKVGNFSIEDSAGFNNLEEFNISNVLKNVEKNLELIAKGESIEIHPHFEKGHIPQEELQLQKEILEKKVSVNKITARLCGFETINIASWEGLEDFRNGKPLRSYMFTEKLHHLPNNCTVAVFAPGAEGELDRAEGGFNTTQEIFTGLIEKNAEGRVSYKFVIN